MNEKELIVETPLGSISVDLGQFAAIQEQIEQKHEQSENNRDSFEEIRKDIVGKDFITPQNTGPGIWVS